MNTTHRSPRKVINLPDLPPEIWLDILRCATWMPSIMDLDSTLEFSLTPARERKRIYRQSLVTKRYVVRVSRQWNQWTMPFLYESILLGRGRSLQSLRDALIRSREDEHPGITGSPLGSWTKRLDLAMRDMSSDQAENLLQIHYISDIIQCLSNLKVVNISSSPYHKNLHKDYFPTEIIQSLSNVCGSNLQAIIWRGRLPTPKLDDWFPFLEKAQNLKTLRCPNFPRVQEMPHLKLISLESLYLQKEPLAGDFPSLRHLITNASPISGWQPLVESHGEKFEIIQLNLKYHSTITQVLSIISSSCTKLARLDVSVTSWDLLGCPVEGCGLVVPRTVRVLGLQNTRKQSSTKGYESLFIGLEHMTFSPVLEYVQLIDEGNVMDLCQKHARSLSLGLDILRKKGMELRDHRGVVIN